MGAVAKAMREDADKIDRLTAENERLRAVVDELRSMETIERLEAENDRLRTDYNAMRRLALDSDEMNDRLRLALRVNAIRYQPELSHDEIDAEIARIVRGDEQNGPSKEWCAAAAEREGDNEVGAGPLAAGDEQGVYTAANGEELPAGSSGATIVNDGRPT